MKKIEDILNDYKNGKLSLIDAITCIKSINFFDMGFAKIDDDRKNRTGANEIVYCENKDADKVKKIFSYLYEQNGEVLGTRANELQFQKVKEVIPSATYDETSRILKVAKKKELKGHIIVMSAGTADIKVADEAYETATFLGSFVEKIYDVGVSGIHRLLAFEETLKKANVIICVAGMEGALASVVAGLVKVPVIACPTSVGYGSNFEGLSALLTMLNSCSNGVTCVNIDNGFGAGYVAHQINTLACK